MFSLTRTLSYSRIFWVVQRIQMSLSKSISVYAEINTEPNIMNISFINTLKETATAKFLGRYL